MVVDPRDIIQALAGSDAQHPVNLSEISKRMPGPPASDEMLRAALGVLVDERAVNTARTSTDGASWRVMYWLTGVQTARINPFRLPLKPAARPDAMAAHQAQAAAEASRASLPITLFPSPASRPSRPQQETTMTRTVRPTKSAKALEVIAARGCIGNKELAEACDIDAKNLSHALEKYFGKQIDKTYDDKGRLFYHLPGQGPSRSATAPAATLNDGHEANIAKLRELAGDDVQHSTQARAPDPMQHAADRLGLDTAQGLRFSIHDDGSLTLMDDEEVIIVPLADVRRLYAFLDGAAGIIEGVRP